jgi:hypothetical protein
MRAVLALEVSVGVPAPPMVRRRSRAEGRARRWDAGPAPTARDLAALRFVGEQYAIRLDVAAVLLTRLSATGPERGVSSAAERSASSWAAGSRPAGPNAAGCWATRG